MANPLWPPSLPQDVLTDGYEESMPDGLLRSPMDAGPPKQRRRFTAGTRTFRMSTDFDRTQAATFETFYRDTLKMGALAFDWIHPRTQVTVTFRFTEPPKMSPLPGARYWRCPLPLEIIP